MDTKMKIKGIQHVGIPTNDIQKSTLFYEGLGFEVVWQTTNKHNEGDVVFLQQGSLIIEIYDNKHAVMKFGAIDHIALDVTDIDSIFSIVKKSGYKILDDKVQYLTFWKHGVRFFTIIGPNEEKIEFCERLIPNQEIL